MDTAAFNSLKDTFVEGGLRLLVPAIMERELFRKYRQQAESCADAVCKAQQMHPMQTLEMWTPYSKEKVIDQCFDELKSQWKGFKSHFKVENLPLVGDLDDVVDWYFGVEPPFSPRKNKEFPDALILSTLDAYYKDHGANIAVVSGDQDFGNACNLRRYICHFDSLEKFVGAFEPELTKEHYFAEKPVDPTQTIATEDLQEIKAILGRGVDATEIEINRVIKLLQPRGENYRYFFFNAKEPMWLPHLEAIGLFENLPEVEPTEDGGFKIPDWPPSSYLARVAESAPDRERVFHILESLPKSTNPRVLAPIVAIVLKSDDSNDLCRFSEKILDFIEHVRWDHNKIIQLVNRLSLMNSNLGRLSESVLLKVIEFRPDQQTEDKRARREANSDDWSTSLEPSPRFHASEYEEILEKGVRPLADREPYRVARILIDAAATMIRLGFHRDELEEIGSNDYSTIWCQRVNVTSREYGESREYLVHSLTFTCEKVYEKSPEFVPALDQMLRNQRWDVFLRIRQHLYALHPNEQTKPWIRELILAHRDFGKWEYQFEFQRMIYLACENFGASLLTTTEMTQIFEAILKGPSEHAFREWKGDRYSEEAFNQRKRYFHRMQLRPFETVLFGGYVGYYQELTSEEEKSVTDDDYAPYKSEGVKGIVEVGPKSVEQLAKMSDEEILSYLNEWENVHRDPDNWWVEINFEGLARAFQTTFKERILPYEARLSFWSKNRERIKRPVYVRAMVSAMHDRVTSKQFDVLDKCFDFCEWVLSHPEQSNEDDANHGDNSREPPGWHSSRRAVGDFVGACLEKEVNVPLSARQALASLLDKLCTQYDRRLDDEEPVLLNREDRLTEAINNTRSRALEDLVDFGYWLRRNSEDEKAETPEVFAILEKRLGSECERPLTLPEYALLGLHFGRICGLNRKWAVQNKSDFFPQEFFKKWKEAFGNFLKYNRANRLIFDIMQEDIEFALENIGNFRTASDATTNLADTLGEHLFTYCLWEVFPLTGKKSLLERFYKKTQDDKDRWSHLFDFVGRSVKNSGKQLREDLKERIIRFFEWRLEKKEPSELRKFTFWLEAECLDAEWRLQSFSSTLDVGGSVDIGVYSQVKALRRMLDNNIPMVVECFAKLVDRTVQNDSTNYIETDNARTILQAGQESDDAAARQNAEQARENLLRRGHFDLLDVEN